jgi:hypothetical protein
MRLTMIAALVGLVGCAQAQVAPEHVDAGRYPNYRAMFQSEMYRASRDRDFADCAGSFMVANVAPADLQQLDRYARGEIPFAATDHDRIDAGLRTKLGSSGVREMLRPYCPDKADGLRIPD